MRCRCGPSFRANAHTTRLSIRLIFAGQTMDRRFNVRQLHNRCNWCCIHVGDAATCSKLNNFFQNYNNRYRSVGVLTCIYVTHRINATAWETDGLLTNDCRRSSTFTPQPPNTANWRTVVRQLPPPSYASVVESEMPPPPYESVVLIPIDPRANDKDAEKCTLGSVTIHM